MRERSDKQQTARIWGALGGTKSIDVHAIWKTDGMRVPGYQPAVFLRHRYHAVHLRPSRSLKPDPALQLAAQLPVVPLRQQLLVKIQCHVVLHQNSLGRRAIVGVLGHLSELELREHWFPLANCLAERGVKGRRIKLLDDVRPAGRGQQVRPWALHQNDFSTNFQKFSRLARITRESYQHLVIVLSGTAHQIVHSDGAAMSQRKRQVRSGHQNHRFIAWSVPGDHRNGATADGEDVLIRERSRRNPRGPKRRAPGLRQSPQRSRIGIGLPAQKIEPVDGFAPEPAEYSPAADGARQKPQVVQLQNPVQKFRRVIPRRGGAVPMQYASACSKNGRPTLLPAAESEIEILHISRLIYLIEAAQLEQFPRIEERAAAASIKNVAQIFAGDGQFASHREIGPLTVGGDRHHGFPGFFATHTFWKEDLRGGAK